MLPGEQTIAVDATMTSFSDIEEDKGVHASMLYNILPSLVTSRVPTLPSIRRSVTSYRTRSLHSKTNSLSDTSSLGTPPPCYTSRPPSGAATPDRGFRDSSIDLSDDASDRPRSSGSSFPLVTTTYEAETGVNWRYASQGKRTQKIQAGFQSLTHLRYNSYVAGISRSEQSDPRRRRDFHNVDTTIIPTWLDVPSAGTASGTFSRRDIKPASCSASRSLLLVH